jgi:hypothetical protein
VCPPSAGCSVSKLQSHVRRRFGNGAVGSHILAAVPNAEKTCTVGYFLRDRGPVAIAPHSYDATATKPTFSLWVLTCFALRARDPVGSIGAMRPLFNRPMNYWRSAMDSE